MVNERKIQEIVEKVLDRVSSDPAVKAIVSSPGSSSSTSSSTMASRTPGIHVPRASAEGRNGIFTDVDSAVEAAWVAHQRLVHETSIDVRAKAIQAIRDLTVQQATNLAKMTVEETGLGRVSHKIEKNKCAALKTPGLEALTPVSFTGDHGLTLDERAPYGVIADITPCTNATETIINNGIGMLAGGNGVVFNVHPAARKTSVHYIRMLNQAMVAAGAPDNLFSCIAEPTIESAGALMKHDRTRIVVVTGGPGVVKAAMATGKKVIAAGPGNPPVLVDETAHIDNAARSICQGASLDNNIVCIVEKEIFAVDAIANQLKQELVRNGAYELKPREIQALEKVIIQDGHVNRKFIGKNPNVILKEIGVQVSEDTPIAFGEVHADHPFVRLEMLMPVLGFVRVPNVSMGIEEAVRAERGCFHTSVMHSTNIDNLHQFARAANTSLFVKNGPSYAGLGLGGEGYTSWTIAGPTGEGLTTAWHFTRFRRCTLVDHFRVV